MIEYIVEGVIVVYLLAMVITNRIDNDRLGKQVRKLERLIIGEDE